MALIATGVGAAGGAGLLGASVAAGGTIAGIGTAAALTSFGALAGVASSVLALTAGLTAKKPPSTGSPDQFRADPEGLVPYVIGRTGTSGNIVFRRAWDTSAKGDNDMQSFVVVHSIGPIKGFESFAVDRVGVTFNANGQAIGGFAGAMWRTTQLGACPEATALTFGTGAGTPPGWTSARKLSGLAAATWTLRFDTKGKLYQNGVPTPKDVVEGVYVYDPRLDSTYPGGSGPCRALSEATYVYSTNPFLHALTWCLGRWQNGVRVIGVGALLAGIDVPAFVQGANIADINGWKVAGVIYSGDPKWGTLQKILQAGMGEPMQLGAQISCMVNAPKVVLATVGEGDLVGEASFSKTLPRRDRVNGIVPRYRQESNDWQMLPGTAIRVPEHEAEDGGRRTKSVDYHFIPSNGTDNDKQIAVACRYDIENAREFAPIVLPLKIRWLGYKPGDCVAVNLPEAGLVNQPVLLLNREFDPSSGIPTFTARSETAGKHPFALGQTTTPPALPGSSVQPLLPAPGIAAWTITATSVAASGTVVPALVIQGAVDSPVADAIVVEYRPFVSGQAAGAGWIAEATLPPSTTKTIITSLQPNISYEVAISYRRNGATGTRTVIGPATTADSPDAPISFTLVDRGGTSVSGGTVTKTATTSAWDASAVSVEKFAAGVTASFKAGQTNAYVAFGLSQNPSASNNFDTIDLVFYVQNDGTAQPRAMGVGFSPTSTPYTTDTIFTATYDGVSTARWYIGDTLAATKTNLPAGLSFGIDSSIYSPGGKFTVVDLSPAGTAGPGGFAHTAYADSADGTVNFSATDATNRLYLGTYTDQIEADSLQPSRYTWQLVKGGRGDPGPGGYAHTAYADSADGTVNFSATDATNRLYLGTYTDQIEADSLQPSRYAWQLVKGGRGDPGPGGFAHTAYADSADGTVNFSATDATNRLYLGTYTDQIEADSLQPSRYAWQLVKGAPGAAALDAAMIPGLLPLNLYANGGVKPGQVPFNFQAVAFDGQTEVTAAAAHALILTNGCDVTANADGVAGRFRVNSISSYPAYFRTSATFGGRTATLTGSIGKANDGQDGAPGGGGNTGFTRTIGPGTGSYPNETNFVLTEPATVPPGKSVTFSFNLNYKPNYNGDQNRSVRMMSNVYYGLNGAFENVQATSSPNAFPHALGGTSSYFGTEHYADAASMSHAYTWTNNTGASADIRVQINLQQNFGSPTGQSIAYDGSYTMNIAQ